MESKKILTAASRYQKFFREYGVNPVKHSADGFCSSREWALEHAHWMVNEIPQFLYKERREKAMRWLCFVQGILWMARLQTIDQLKEDNRSD